MSSVEEYLSLQKQLDDYYRFNRAELYDPYPFQRKFHYALGKGTEDYAAQKCLMCANQIGKTTCAAQEVMFYTTGEYPEDWKGRVYEEPIVWVCAGVSNDSTKRIIQTELLGGMKGTPEWGTGAIPLKYLGEPTRKSGVPDAYESVKIHGKYGISTIWLMAYEQGWQKFQGLRFKGAWADEEPPVDIWSQLLRGTIAQKDALLMITMTPEEGETDVVYSFRSDLKTGQALVTATWDDAAHDDDTERHNKGDSHLTEEKKAQMLEAIPPHQREMRSKGIPFMGSGLVFPLNEEDFVCDPFKIPDYWPGIIGFDFGIAHPFAASLLRVNPDTQQVYLTNTYRRSDATPPIHREGLRGWGNYPVMWPHDGEIRDKGTGTSLKAQYEAQGFRLHDKCFSNPPGQDREGKGGSSVEAGLFAMLTGMESGTFKVFSTCNEFLDERRSFHRKNGVLVKERDDSISSARYAYQMRRFALALGVNSQNAPVKAKVKWGGLHD